MTHEQLHNFVSEKGEREFNPQETLQVLTHNRTTYWSWGVSKLLNMFNKGLCLKVSGHHHKGWVIITLGFTDTYSVFYVSNNGKVKDEQHLVYFDELTERIDDKIERIPIYKH
jgi:hypothetical protein